ncbi:MAG: hypothetical protein COA73_12460 [Candidatus Hydrogenedentota bacterium]|nr:MAG: hypothetical protein COA73_12460 [Candidatus Hydrogenedentota bacterium]
MRTFLAILVLFSTSALADSVIIEGKQYNNVTVRETSSLIYVQFSDTNKSLSFRKSKIEDGTLQILRDTFPEKESEVPEKEIPKEDLPVVEQKLVSETIRTETDPDDVEQPNQITLIAQTDDSPPLAVKGIEADKRCDCKHIDSLDTRSGDYGDSACAKGSEMWFSEVSFLGKNTTMIIQQTTTTRRVVAIVLTDFDFEKAVSSFTKKYGTPTVENSVLENGFGAKFDQVEAIWTQGEISLRIAKHGMKTRESTLYLSGKLFNKNAEKSSSPSDDI